MTRTNLEVKVLTYTGNGVDNTSIAGTFGLHPGLAIVKGGANIACFKTRRMPFDSTAFFAGNTANFAGGVKALLANGLNLGTDAKANANATVYHALIIGWTNAQAYARAIDYVGNGSDSRQLTAAGLNFQPDFFFTKRDGADNPSARSLSISGDNSWHYSGTADASNEIQNFVANGVELGTSTRVNGSASTYYAFGMRNLPGIVTYGSYTGNGLDNRTVAHDLGYTPDWLIVKNAAQTTGAILWLSTMTATQSAPVGASAPTTGFVKAVGATTFTVGSSATVNGDTNTHYFVAGRAGQFSVPLSRAAA